jgi:uncharacterized membrane protein
MSMGDRTGRLDAFTDAAFAFAVSLLVIGGGEAPKDFDQLLRALKDAPAFVFGFTVIAVFWLGHVRWRALRGEGDTRSLLLTLLLVFLVLIYVQPLRSMASATGLWLRGEGAAYRGNIAGLFAVYGSGFAVMSAAMAALFRDALRNPDLEGAGRRKARGECAIWLILAATGALSVAVSFTRYGVWAAMLYTTLPLTIGLFASRYDWKGERGPG